MKLVKVLKQSMAKDLSNKGFTFSTEKLNGIELFVFEQTPELLKELNKNFSLNKTDYFVDTRMNFEKKKGA
jgi:hypothetical protein